MPPEEASEILRQFDREFDRLFMHVMTHGSGGLRLDYDTGKITQFPYDGVCVLDPETPTGSMG
jgi:hypothetical protein